MKIVEYGYNKYRIQTGWWIFSWWVTFAGTGIPVQFDTREDAERWMIAMKKWEARGNEF